MRSAASRIHDCSTAIECSELTPQSGTMPWICAYLAIDAAGKANGHGGEAVMHDGRVVGSTSSVAYGHSVGKVLAFAYIKPEAAAPGTALEVVVMNEARKAVVLGEAAWDPQNLLPRTDG
jgi:dimethylglycine dehydrogenase